MMKKGVSLVTVAIFLFSLTGCATTQQEGSTEPSAGKGAIIGVIAGAAAGALTSAVAGDTENIEKYILIGATLGGITGFVVGKYRENQYKTAQQVYKENPYYAKKQAKSEPPAVKNLVPHILDKNGKTVNVIKNGQGIELGMDYDIIIPKFSDNKQIDVIEFNTLVSQNGKAMRLPLRNKKREVGGVSAGIEVSMPKNLPAGNYTHVSVVKIEGKEYKKEQQVMVAKSNDEIKLYAAKEK